MMDWREMMGAPRPDSHSQYTHYSQKSEGGGISENYENYENGGRIGAEGTEPPAADPFPRDLTLLILLGMVAHLCCRRRFYDRRQRPVIEYDLSTDPPLIRLARALATVAPDLPALTLAAENAADLDGLSARLEAVLSTEAGQAAAWALIDQAEQVRR